jgi:cation diffusion facilitator CzcD-associated flavoprotein CzcO
MRRILVTSVFVNTGSEPPRFDPEAVHAKYLEERDKRLIEGRAAIRDLTTDTSFSKYREDPFTPFVHRNGLSDEVDVVIIGAGVAGLVAGAELRKAGLRRIRLIDQAGGVGGTWYWNRYPGVMCDVESYIYMPMLEDLNYVPKNRYAFGDEIRAHLEAIADKYDLIENSLFHTGVISSTWDERTCRWVLLTDRGDEIRARYLVMAVGILNLMKMPDIPGMELFKGKSFHTARWDYDYTGGDLHGNLTNLADKVVGIMGTGASAIQAIAPLAESSKHLYVFQRTPNAVGVRGNRPTSEEFVKSLHPGWQRERMYNFQSILDGRPVEVDMINDGWTRHTAKVWNPRMEPGMSLEEFILKAETEDFLIMEEHRSRIDEIVSDPRTAEILKPYYRYLCKRPCFHDEYLPAFNRENVTLIDCPSGIERVTEQGLICNGEKFELDCLIYATGFEAEMTPLPRRVGHAVTGRNGTRLADKWEPGAASLHGMMSSGFPNMFIMPSPGQQAVVGVNITLISVEGAEHIGATVKMLEERGIRLFDVNSQSETEYVEQIVGSFVDASSVMAACTPSRINFEGNPSSFNPRSGSWGGGRGDFFGFFKMLTDWRAQGDFVGLDLDQPAVR